MKMLKVTKIQAFAFSPEDTLFEKPQEGDQIDSPSHLTVKSNSFMVTEKVKKVPMTQNF